MKIGAVVRLGALPGGQPPSYTQIRDMARRIEAAGFDSIWLYDHLLYRWPGRPTDGIWECWTMLSALAEATQRVELGTLVLCTQFRNPALLAKMAATLDEISGGRLTLGLGAGWHQPEFDAFGFPFDHRASRFEEALQIIRPLLREGYVNFHGSYYAADQCELLPRGPRPGGPPIMIAGAGPRMLRIAAQYADSWNSAWHGRPESIHARLQLVRDACEQSGRDPATLGITASVGVAFPDLGGSGPIREPLTGTPQKIAAALRGYSALGIQHVMIEFAPYTPEALDRLAEAVSAARD
ncbi:MAG: LLM class flavin-dependent oxidoreductase [Chloroflexi bacterium]|nr:LLM class flavin-dependent oxidoreductase [Chloroflexota bacterium]